MQAESPPLPYRLLVLGGQRSGKSGFAERLATQSGLSKVLIATAHAGDAEMAARIARHRKRRPADWRTLEVPVELAAALAHEARAERVVVVDCLTLWLSNLMLEGKDLEAAGRELCAVVAGLPGLVVLVSNEVGQGVVPTNAMARRFVDAAGELHQALAAAVERVVLTVAGLPVELKPRAPV